MQQFVDQLNQNFGNLRAVLSGVEDKSESTLIGPTIIRFTETLDDVAASCPDLERKCSDLVRQLRTFLDPATTETSDEFPEDGL
jgi:hypothetical protein